MKRIATWQIDAMSFEVFISYAHQDKPIANAACAIIEKAGIRCWIAPRDVTPGAEYPTALSEALERCDALVLIFSGRANESPHIRREVERAVSRGIPLIPVRIEDIEPSAALKYFVSSVHWLDALSPPPEQHFERLAKALKTILDKEGQNRGAPVGPAHRDEPAPVDAQKVKARQALSWYIRLITATPLRWLVATAIVLCVAFAAVLTQLPFRHYFPLNIPDNFDVRTPALENPRLESFSYTPGSVTPPFAVPTQWTRMSDAGTDYWIAKNTEGTVALRFNIRRRINNDDCIGTVVYMQGSGDNQVFVPDVQSGCQNHELSFRVTGIAPWQVLGEIKPGN